MLQSISVMLALGSDCGVRFERSAGFIIRITETVFEKMIKDKSLRIVFRGEPLGKHTMT